MYIEEDDDRSLDRGKEREMNRGGDSDCDSNKDRNMGGGRDGWLCEG